MFYVIHINNLGRPGVLHGPYSWDNAVEVCVRLVTELIDKDSRPADVAELTEKVQCDCGFENQDDIDGVYIIQCE